MVGTSQGIHSPEEVMEILQSPSMEALIQYRDLYEETEPPREFLDWSLIAAAAGLLGKNAILRMGPSRAVRPNLYVVLIGPSGSRKSSAIKLVERLIEHSTINFGPTDSAGDRRGIMSSLAGLHRGDNYLFRAGHYPESALTRSMFRPRVSSDLFLSSKELGRLMGAGSREMADFFVDLFDGESIVYETKASSTVITTPLVTLLGACTPSSLATMIPANATEHGVLARILFVYADKRYKDVAIPKEPKPEWYDALEAMQDRLRWIDNNRLDFSITPDADKFYEQIYNFVAPIEDPRINHYQERRAEHMLKVAIALAALRNDNRVNIWDIKAAHEMLFIIEPNMHRAVEHFGRNKSFVGRMLIINYLRAAEKQSASREELIGAAMADLNHREAEEALMSMVSRKEISALGNTFFLNTALNEQFVASKKKGGPKTA